MNSTRLFVVIILIVLGVLLFKPKSKPIEQATNNEENIAAIEPEAEKDKSKLQVEEGVDVLKSQNLNNPLSKKLNPDETPTVTPSPASSAEETKVESALADKNTDPNEALRKLNENKLKNVFRMPKSVELTAAQEKQMEAVKNKYTPQLEAQLNKMEDVLNDDQKRARNEALVGLVFEGDRPDVKHDVVKNAMNLTGDQERQLRELNREFNQMRTRARQEMAKSMTPEQLSTLPPNWLGGRRGARP